MGMGRFLSVILASIVLLTACGGTDDPGDAPATATLEITALAGPVCPVETDPPSPDCAPRPVDAAVIIVTDSEGTEVARGTTGTDGRVIIDVTPGQLTIVPQSVDGLLGTAAAVTVTMTAGQRTQVAIEYDTGVR
jgi:major membrane immunogen (membrane-anchored lipoprotein)